MKYLGIDYGTKRIGVALSDEGGTIAFPYEIVTPSQKLIQELKLLTQKENVGEIVIGESLDHFGKPNKIMSEIARFAMELGEELDMPIHFEKEFLTSHHSVLHRGKSVLTARKTKAKASEPVDASAAALILQRYLDRVKKK